MFSIWWWLTDRAGFLRGRGHLVQSSGAAAGLSFGSAGGQGCKAFCK